MTARRLRRQVRVIPLVIWLAVLSGAPAGAGMPFRDDFSGYPAGETWAEGSAHGIWAVRYHGYGSVRVGCAKVLELAPAQATAAAETHASLVTTRTTHRNGVLDLEARTVRQLRTNGPPNPWETAWVIFRYVDDEHFYYLALKTNGWELGKRDPAYPGGQRFLDTGTNPRFDVGTWVRVRVTMTANALSVELDGVAVSATVDGERPILAGAVGLYTEDAHVQFAKVAFAET